MSETKRVSVHDVRERLQAGEPTLLVCAYPSEEKFRRAQLEGAISFDEFQKRKPSLPRDLEVVFY